MTAWSAWAGGAGGVGGGGGGAGGDGAGGGAGGGAGFDLLDHAEEQGHGPEIGGGGLVDELGDDDFALGDDAALAVLGDDDAPVERLAEQGGEALGAFRAACGIAGATLLEAGVLGRAAVADLVGGIIRHARSPGRRRWVAGRARRGGLCRR
jgi:hypothetical protein